MIARRHRSGAMAPSARPELAVRRLGRLSRRHSGYSLVEMIVAVIVAGVLLSIGVPRFAQSLEQSRADVAGANLRSIWSAQRLYWLQNRTYAPDLTHLMSRDTIGSGATPNTRENLRNWIRDPSSIKPGAKMPALQLTPGQIDDVTSFLETLR